MTKAVGYIRVSTQGQVRDGYSLSYQRDEIIFKSSKILRFKNAKDRLFSAFEQGAEFHSLELYSLPDDYQVAAYDYRVYMSRTIYDDGANILVTVSQDYFDQLDFQQVAINLKQFIQVERGRIFEMSNLESPQLYAAVPMKYQVTLVF